MSGGVIDAHALEPAVADAVWHVLDLCAEDGNDAPRGRRVRLGGLVDVIEVYDEGEDRRWQILPDGYVTWNSSSQRLYRLAVERSAS